MWLTEAVVGDGFAIIVVLTVVTDVGAGGLCCSFIFGRHNNERVPPRRAHLTHLRFGTGVSFFVALLVNFSKFPH